MSLVDPEHKMERKGAGKGCKIGFQGGQPGEEKCLSDSNLL